MSNTITTIDDVTTALVLLGDADEELRLRAAVDLSDGRRVFAPEGTDPEAVRVHVAEQENKR